MGNVISDCTTVVELQEKHPNPPKGSVAMVKEHGSLELSHFKGDLICHFDGEQWYFNQVPEWLRAYVDCRMAFR